MNTIDVKGAEIVRGEVRSEWIDLNGHMNVASYVTAFEVAVYALWARFGMAQEYQRDTGNTTFAVETHTTYKRELGEGDAYVISALVLAYDGKRVHNFLRMYDAQQGFLSATIEWLGLHVSIDQRRAVPWPDAVREGIRKFAESQPESAAPPEAGRQIRLRKPVFSVLGEEL